MKLATVSQKSSGKSTVKYNLFDAMPPTVKTAISDQDINTKTITTFTANAHLSKYQTNYKLLSAEDDINSFQLLGIDTAAGQTNELNRNKIYKGVDAVLVVGKPYGQEWTAITNTINEFSSAFTGKEEKKPKLIICLTDIKNENDYIKRVRTISNIVAVNNGYVMKNYIPHIPHQPQMFEVGISAARPLDKKHFEAMDIQLSDDQFQILQTQYGCISQKIKAASLELLDVLGIKA